MFICKLFRSLGGGLVEVGVDVMKTKRGRLRSCGDGGDVYGNLFLGSLMGLMIVAKYKKNIYLFGTLLGLLVTH